LLHQYLPILVFASLGIIVGAAFATLNLVLGPKRL
jgi:NADH:ubiquinone oxidoreductase subunit 3 (subunit A)